MKWLWIAVAVVVGLPILLYGAMFVYFNLIGNDQVAEELRASPDGERAGIVMLLTLPDGREIPVNYLREENQVFAGADGRWWTVLREGNQPVRVHIKGREYAGTARVVLDDPEYTRDVFSRLRPTAPSWLPEWLGGKLIVIDLQL